MSIKVTTHRLFGHRGVLREIQDAAPVAADLVRSSVPGRLPSTRIVLTTPAGITDLSAEADGHVLGRSITPQERAGAEGAIYPSARHVFGVTCLARGGAALILLNARKTTPGQIGVTLVHELVHAMQFTRPGVRDLLVKGVRNNYGIKDLSPRDLHAYNRMLAAQEEEAYRMESILAPHLTHRLAA